MQCHKPLDLLTDIAYCPPQARIAVGGGSSVKLIDVGAEYGEVAGQGVELPPGHSVEQLGWGQDGQVCAGMGMTWDAVQPPHCRPTCPSP